MKCMLCKQLFEEEDEPTNPVPTYGVCKECMLKLNRDVVEIKDEDIYYYQTA